MYELPGTPVVPVERPIAYRRTDAGSVSMDLYRSPDCRRGEKRPAVLFVTGYPDPGFEAMVGCQLKEMAGYVSWGELVAASGMIGITYDNRDPVADLHALLDYLHERAEALGIDEQRMAIWSCSGNVPNALGLLLRDAPLRLRAAVLCYGAMLDLDGSTAIADLCARFGAANPCAARPSRTSRLICRS